MSTSPNVYWHEHAIERHDRETQSGHRSCLLWFTGLSGAGKSTLAQAVDQRLHQLGCRSYVLDGDNVRHHLCGDLGFDDASRKENIRRISEVAKLFVDAGTITLTAFISPLREDRERARAIVADGDFIEIFCDAGLDVCEKRDVKGLYKRARAGEIPHFTGISSPYEAPHNAEIVVRTGEHSIDECVDQVLRYLVQNKDLSLKPLAAA